MNSEYYEYLKKTYGEAVANRYQQVTLSPAKPRANKSSKKAYGSNYSIYKPSPGEPMAKRVRKQFCVYYEWDGLSLSAKEWAAHLGISTYAFYARLHFWGLYAPTFTRKNSHFDRTGRTKTYTFDGQTLTAEQWSKVLGISLISFYHRVRRYPKNDPRIYHRGSLSRGRPSARFRNC